MVKNARPRCAWIHWYNSSYENIFSRKYILNAYYVKARTQCQGMQKSTRGSLSITSLHKTGNCRCLLPEIFLTIHGPAQISSPLEATLLCSDVLTSVPPCTAICVYVPCSIFIDCKSLEDRDVFGEAFSSGSQKKHWQAQADLMNVAEETRRLLVVFSTLLSDAASSYLVGGI